MNEISIIPRHNAISLSNDYSFERLQSHPQQQIFPQDHTQDIKDRLLHAHSSEAALVQYVLVDAKGEKTVPVITRLKEESLSLIDPSEMYVSMRWVILDWDLPSKGTAWGDKAKPETKEQVKDFIRNHPKLKYAYAFYFSKSGVRIMFRLDNPLNLTSSSDVLVWKQFFANFVGLLDISEIGGELELKKDPFTLNRVPCYTDSKGNQVVGEIVFQSTSRSIKVTYPKHEDVAQPERPVTKTSYGQLPSNIVKECLWTEPLIVHLRESKAALSYPDWRAIGTNIAALLGEAGGLTVFHEVSSWDVANYDASAVDQQWPHIVKSVNDYGPVTWSQFTFDLSSVYAHISPRSSLAARVRRAIGDAQAGVVNPLADNTQEVIKALQMKTTVKGNTTVSTPVKSPTNLLTILTLDNRWRNQIKRNHLGSVDMLGDERISDEMLVAIRETISRIYNLNFAKDDCWDFVKLIAMKNEYNPVADYFGGLTWDGQDRIAGLAQALGQSDVFATKVLEKFLISCVVRPIEWNNYSPSVNWKIDTVLILKGSQGKRKSSFFKALCSDEEWFSDNLPSITAERKDASLHMLGKWIVEQAEFEGHVARSSVEMMKAFITREREIFRKPYGRAETNMRRPSVLVGTTNSSNFLNDPTGDRRFWVLEIPEDKTIDLAWVQQNRDQLWAQAVELYRQGVIWWLTEAETQKSNKQNSKFRRPDALGEAILEFVNTNPTMAGITKDERFEDGIGFTLKQLVSVGLDKKLADIKSYEAQNITMHLSRLGFTKRRVRVNGKRTYIFRKTKGFDDEEVL